MYNPYQSGSDNVLIKAEWDLINKDEKDIVP